LAESGRRNVSDVCSPLPHFYDPEYAQTCRVNSPIRPPASTPLPGNRLLLVDDDNRVRAALVALLASVREIEVVGSCADAAEARSLVAVVQPDLVLLDVLLPTAREGLELLRALRAEGIPAVAMSISGGLRDAALSAGAVAFLEKEGSPEALIAVLLEAVRCGNPPTVT
jgi:DNA-binding NarL/FixJ family response regulator